MPRRPGGIFFSLLLLTLFSLAGEARADTVAITNGSITFISNGIGDNTFSLVGDGLSIHGITGFLFVGNTNPDTDFGGRATLGRTLDNDDLYMSTPFTVRGIEYFGWSSLDDNLLLNIAAPSFAFPTDPITTFTSVTFSSTFTMDGFIRLRYTDPIGQRTDLTGQGIVSAIYSHGPNFPNIWRLNSLTYTFQATPTPEPATLLLLGTGLAGVATKVYRRRKASGQI